jgi:glycolate oxidase
LINPLRTTVGDRYVLVEKEDVIVYEQDGSISHVMPEVVVLPADVEQVAAVVKAGRRAAVPIVPCGLGTGLRGRKIAAD